MSEEEITGLEPQTDAERELVEQLRRVGVEDGIRPEFFDQAVVGVQEEIQKRALTKIGRKVKSKSAAVLMLRPKLKQLREVGGERFMEPEAVFEALQKISLTVPDQEKVRLLAEFEAELKGERGDFEGFVAKCRRIRTTSEDQEPPMIKKLPNQVVVPDGEVKVFNIEEMHRAMQAAKQAGTVGKPTYLSGYVRPETKTQQWGSDLRAWTSTCLEGSKNRRYTGENGQLAYQKQVLSEGHEIHADMFLAMVLRYLQSGEELMRSDFMRFNDTGTAGDPLSVDVDDGDRRLYGSHGNARPRGGLGASLSISS